MKKHIFEISHPAAGTPSKALPDGAFTGNGDLTAVLAGSADRVRIHIGKADFWKADGRVYTEHRGGIAPLGLAEILLPQLAYAEYQVEQNLDKACITLHLTEGKLCPCHRCPAECLQWRTQRFCRNGRTGFQPGGRIPPSLWLGG